MSEDTLESGRGPAQAIELDRQELAAEQQAIADTLALSGRVNDERRANPADEARWTKLEAIMDALKPESSLRAPVLGARERARVVFWGVHVAQYFVRPQLHHLQVLRVGVEKSP